jgi:hypothetical protein
MEGKRNGINKGLTGVMNELIKGEINGGINI